jgi:hypothetical protein
MTGSFENLIRLFLIAGLQIAQRGHLHVRAHIHVAVLHGMHGVSAAVVAHGGHVVHIGCSYVGLGVGRHIHVRHGVFFFLLLRRGKAHR